MLAESKGYREGRAGLHYVRPPQELCIAFLGNHAEPCAFVADSHENSQFACDRQIDQIVLRQDVQPDN